MSTQPSPTPLRSERASAAILGLLVVRIGKEAHDAKHLGVAIAVVAQRDESHFARVIDLGHPRQEGDGRIRVPASSS